jgi:hypothetical protein
MGVIITLVFFVLATVILGVTTYFGFADQEAKVKEKNDALAKEKSREAERNWERFKVRVLLQYYGKPPAGLDAKDLAREKAAFDKSPAGLTFAQADKDAFAALVKELDKTMGWDASKTDAPPITVETRLAAKDKDYATLQKAMDQLKKQKEDADAELQKTLAALDDERKTFKTALEKGDKKMDDDRTTDRKTINDMRDDLVEAGKKTEKVTIALADTKKKLDSALASIRGLETKLTKEVGDKKEVREELDRARQTLQTLADRSGADLRAMEAEALDAKAMLVLKSWNKPWKIIGMDAKGTMPYIDLGSADGLQPQVTFSIHSSGADGKLNPSPKGTLEVVKIMGAHMAQARLTSVKDRKKDPILRGDRLFNPTWDPSRKRHVALAGFPDLAGDGTDSLTEFRRLLAKQNVELDAYIDTKDDKAPKVVGKGVSVNTDYLVLADSLEGTAHPMAKNNPYKTAFNQMVNDMKAKAASNGVTVITLKKYLDMIGYRTGKAANSPDAMRPGGGYR